MRFSLVRLMTVTVFLALFAFSWASHSRTRKEALRIDLEIGSALQDLAPLVSSHLKINAGQDGFPPIDPYSYGGNGHGFSSGGMIDGPCSIDRSVVVGDGVNLTIETRAEWGIVPGRVFVQIRQKEGHANDWFVSQLKQLLSKRGIVIKNQNIINESSNPTQ